MVVLRVMGFIGLCRVWCCMYLQGFDWAAQSFREFDRAWVYDGLNAELLDGNCTIALIVAMHPSCSCHDHFLRG